MKLILKKLAIILFLFLTNSNLNAETPHYLDFKFILNESDAGKKAQTQLKNRLDKGIKSIREKGILRNTGIELSILVVKHNNAEATNFYKIKDPKNLEKVTRIFFNHRRKMLKKPFNQLFNGDQRVLNDPKIDLNLRPQNLDFDTYYQLTCAYENLRS